MMYRLYSTLYIDDQYNPKMEENTCCLHIFYKIMFIDGHKIEYIIKNII